MNRLYMITKDIDGVRYYLGPDFHLGYPMWFNEERQSFIFASAAFAEAYMESEMTYETDWVVRPYWED